MRKIKKGDDVMVVAGKDKGKRGAVLRVVDAEHVVIEGANKVKKHQRPNPMRGLAGGIVEKEMPLHVSKVAIVDPKDGKATRVRFETSKDGKKVRVAARSGEKIDG